MKIMVAIIVLLSNTAIAQIKNATTEQVKIYGNCGMCETKIEKAGNIKKIANVDWNHETQMATLTYDAKKTNQDEILKRIALVGYDSDKFLAPDDVYNNLHGCCQYDRVAKVPVKEDNKTTASSEDHSNHNHSEMITTEVQKDNQLKVIFDNYFLLKDALIASDGTKTALASKELLTAVNNVKMDKLETSLIKLYIYLALKVNGNTALEEKIQKSIKKQELKIDSSKSIGQIEQNISSISRLKKPKK